MNQRQAKKIRREAKIAQLTEESQYANVAPDGKPVQVVLAECQKALEKHLKRTMKENKVN